MESTENSTSFLSPSDDTKITEYKETTGENFGANVGEIKNSSGSQKVPRPDLVPRLLPRFICRQVKRCIFCGAADYLKHTKNSTHDINFLHELRELIIRGITPTLFLNYKKGELAYLRNPIFPGVLCRKNPLKMRDKRKRSKLGKNRFDETSFPFCLDNENCPGLQRMVALDNLFDEFQSLLKTLNLARLNIFRNVVEEFLKEKMADPTEDRDLGGIDDALKLWCNTIGLSDELMLEIKDDDEMTTSIQSEAAPELNNILIEVKEEPLVEEVEGQNLDFFDDSDYQIIPENVQEKDVNLDYIIIPDYLRGLDLNPFVKLDRNLDEGEPLSKYARKIARESLKRKIKSVNKPKPLSKKTKKMKAETTEVTPHTVSSTTTPQSPVKMSRSGRIIKARLIPESEPLTDEEKIDKNDMDDDEFEFEGMPEDDAEVKISDLEESEDEQEDEELRDVEIDVEFKPTKHYTRRPPEEQIKKEKKPRPPPRDPNVPKPKRIRKKYPRQSCPVCKKEVAGGAWNLRLHMRTHTGERPFPCPHEGCGMAFYKQSNRDTHFRAVHGDPTTYRHVCRFCGNRYPEKSALHSHMDRNHRLKEDNCVNSELKFGCPLCNQLFAASSGLHKHLEKCHEGENIPDTIMNNSKKMPALNNTKIVNVIKCKDCEYVCKMKYQLGRHQNKRHSSAADASNTKKPTVDSEKRVKEVYPRQCKKAECDVICNTRREYLKHIKNDHPPDPSSKDLMCHVCGRIFNRKGNLDKHIRTHVDTEKQFVCATCGSSFLHKISLQFHESTHTGIYIFQCEYCPEGFNSQWKFRRHLCLEHAEQHLKDKPHVCKCYYNFATEQELQEHTTLTHEESTKCKICGKIFAFRQHLRRHMVIHDGSKPFKCNYCDKAFTQSGNLAEHVQRHTGERKYICPLCSMGFLRKKAMNQHQEQCNGKPPKMRTGSRKVAPVGQNSSRDSSSESEEEEEEQIVSYSLSFSSSVISSQ